VINDDGVLYKGGRVDGCSVVFSGYDN
jgi:hypothetical protein